MATFYCVKGSPIENAQYYELYKKTDGAYSFLSQQKKQLYLPTFLDTSSKTFHGAIGDGGNPTEINITLTYAGSTTGRFIPMVKLTETGYRYYFRFKGYFNVKTTTSDYPSNGVPFDGVLYMDSQEEVDSVSFEDTLSVKSNGIFLKTNLGDVNIYNTALDVEKIESVTLSPSVEFFSAPVGYYRTEPIPIDVLTDELDGGYCYGKVVSTDFSGVALYKIAYYDENMTFLGGATRDTIISVIGTGRHYVTVSEIRTSIASKVLDVSNMNAIAFVVFSGTDKDQEGEADVVSIGGIYFPLFDPPYKNQLQYGDKLTVKAIGDGFFFKDSDYAEPVTYPDVNS